MNVTNVYEKHILRNNKNLKIKNVNKGKHKEKLKQYTQEYI